jgi:hypothetical protein
MWIRNNVFVLNLTHVMEKELNVFNELDTI